MADTIQDARQAELPWPAERVKCVRCVGDGTVRSRQVPGRRVTHKPCPECHGSGAVTAPLQIEMLTL